MTFSFDVNSKLIPKDADPGEYLRAIIEADPEGFISMFQISGDNIWVDVQKKLRAI